MRIGNICGIFIFVLFALVILQGCSTHQNVQKEKVKEKIETPINREIAKIKVIAGSLYDTKGDYASAILEYQDALRFDKDPGIYYLLAKDYNSLGKYALAVENIRESINKDPKNIVYHDLLGDIFFTAFEVDSAITEFEAILKLDSSNIQAVFSLATLYKKSKPLTSIKLYKKLIDEIGPRWDILVNLLEIYGTLDKSSEELNALEDLLDLDPGNAKLKQLLAEFYIKSGKFEKAVSMIEDLLELDPENDNLNRALADYYAGNNKTEKAIEIYKGILNRRKNDIEVQGAIAFLYARNKDWENANKYFVNILNNDSIRIEIKIDLGSFCYSLSDSDKNALKYSKNLFSKITENYPEDPRAYMYLSAIGVKEDSLEVVENNYEKFLALEEKSHVAYKFPMYGNEVGRLFLAKDDFRNAVKYLERTKKIFNDDFFLLYYLGFSYSRLNETGKAISTLEKVLQYNPTHEIRVEILGQLGLLYDGMKNYTKSDSLYESGLKLDPENHLLLNNFSYSLSERGLQLDRSEKMSKKALEKEPENSSYLDTYGWILYRQGKYNEAEKYIKKAVGLRDATGGNGAVLNEHLGDVYIKIGDTEKAIYYWNKSLEMNPENQEVKEKISKHKS
jgi:tetratricopeptide (TPR) repeat protein